MIIFALLALISLVGNLVIIALRGTTASPLRVVAGSSIIAGFFLLFVSAFWGLVKRRPYGRRLGLLAMICIWLLVLYTQRRPPSGPIEPYHFNSTAELVGGFISALAISALFLILIFNLAFSKTVKAFFERNASAGTEMLPPAK